MRPSTRGLAIPDENPRSRVPAHTRRLEPHTRPRTPRCRAQPSWADLAWRDPCALSPAAHRREHARPSPDRHGCRDRYFPRLDARRLGCGTRDLVLGNNSGGRNVAGATACARRRPTRHEDLPRVRRDREGGGDNLPLLSPQVRLRGSVRRRTIGSASRSPRLLTKEKGPRFSAGAQYGKRSHSLAERGLTARERMTVGPTCLRTP